MTEPSWGLLSLVAMKGHHGVNGCRFHFAWNVPLAASSGLRLVLHAYPEKMISFPGGLSLWLRP